MSSIVRLRDLVDLPFRFPHRREVLLHEEVPRHYRGVLRRMSVVEKDRLHDGVAVDVVEEGQRLSSSAADAVTTCIITTRGDLVGIECEDDAVECREPV